MYRLLLYIFDIRKIVNAELHMNYSDRYNNNMYIKNYENIFAYIVCVRQIITITYIKTVCFEYFISIYMKYIYIYI